MIWLREILEWQKELTNPAEFLEYLKVDLFSEDIFVFTPRRELKHLPKGSTPLDFAYAIHTDIGNHCIGAKINGRMIPLSTPLSSSDEVEILTSSQQEPSQDWLKIVKTSKARSKIKHWLKQKGYEQSLALGKELLEKEFKRHRLKPLAEQELTDLAMSLNFAGTEAMYVALGNGNFSLNTIISKILPPEEKEEKKETLVRKIIEKARRTQGIKIQGLGNLMFRFAQCCQPVPGEEIVGFITRGRGISIHRADCPNALLLLADPERKIKVDWDVDKSQSFLVRLEVLVEERKNMLKDLTEAIADADTNIRSVEINADKTTASGSFLIEVKNLSHLNKTIKKIKKVKGVISVERTKGIEPDYEKGIQA
jgi:GTP pyrophosphokinase